MSISAEIPLAAEDQDLIDLDPQAEILAGVMALPCVKDEDGNDVKVPRIPSCFHDNINKYYFSIKLKGVCGGSVSGGRLLRLPATPHSLLLPARRGGERICRKPRIIAQEIVGVACIRLDTFDHLANDSTYFLAVSFRSGSHICKKNLCMGFVSFFRVIAKASTPSYTSGQCGERGLLLMHDFFKRKKHAQLYTD